VDQRSFSSYKVGKGRTALVVDDVDDFRGYVARVLQMLGFDVWQAQDAVAAMELLDEREHSPDVAVLDVSLPGLTGPELATCLLDRWGEMGVVFMSGYAPNYLRNKGVLPDGATFLRKPFLLADVADAVSGVMATANPEDYQWAGEAFCVAQGADCLVAAAE